MLTTFLWVECYWGKIPGILFPPWYFEAEVLQVGVGDMTKILYHDMTNLIS